MAKQRFEDLGFAGKAAEARARLLNPDGSFNIRRKGLSFTQYFSSYHYLIGISWWKFNLIVLASFLLMNLGFAALYMVAGTDGMVGIDGRSMTSRFLESFFFSTQTFTTVGYGRVSPVGLWTNVIAALESLTGLLSFALATGLIYGRFSRPTARILFSRNAVVAPYGDDTGLMFRIANERTNQLIEVEAQVVLIRLETLANGTQARKFYQLDLERDKLNFFHLSWTVVHPIEPTSPLFGVTKEALDASDAEIVVLIKAFDDTFSQTVHTRTSYKHHEILYGKRFSPIIHTAQDGVTEITLDEIDAVDPT